MSEGVAEYEVLARYPVRVVRENGTATVSLSTGRVIGWVRRREEGLYVVGSSVGPLLMVCGEDEVVDERLIARLVGQLGIEDGELSIERSG